MRLNVDFKKTVVSFLIMIFILLLAITLKVYIFKDAQKNIPGKSETEVKYEILKKDLEMRFNLTDSLLKVYNSRPTPSKVITIIQKEANNGKDAVTHLPISGKIKYLSNWIDSLKRLN
jgi:hypothetical protein